MYFSAVSPFFLYTLKKLLCVPDSIGLLGGAFGGFELTAGGHDVFATGTPNGRSDVVILKDLGKTVNGVVAAGLERRAFPIMERDEVDFNF